MSHDHGGKDRAHEAAERDQLLTYLDGLGIAAPVVAYPAHASVEEGKRLRGQLPGTFTKNLLLKDKKGALFFITAHEDTTIDLKTLHTRIGASGRLRFAPVETMVELLHVRPGTATPLALHHDGDGVITLVVDHTLDGAAHLNFHPMSHTDSLAISWADFLTFTTSTGHPPSLTDLTAPSTEAT